MRLDPVPAHYDPLGHASREQFLSNRTIHRVGRRCHRQVSHRQAITLFFYYEFEVCPRVHGTMIDVPQQQLYAAPR